MSNESRHKKPYAKNPAVNRRVHLALEAVKGLSDEDLEAGAVGKLVEAAKFARNEFSGTPRSNMILACCLNLMNDALKPWEVKA